MRTMGTDDYGRRMYGLGRALNRTEIRAAGLGAPIDTRRNASFADIGDRRGFHVSPNNIGNGFGIMYSNGRGTVVPFAPHLLHDNNRLRLADGGMVSVGDLTKKGKMPLSDLLNQVFSGKLSTNGMSVTGGEELLPMEIARKSFARIAPRGEYGLDDQARDDDAQAGSARRTLINRLIDRGQKYAGHGLDALGTVFPPFLPYAPHLMGTSIKNPSYGGASPFANIGDAVDSAQSGDHRGAALNSLYAALAVAPLKGGSRLIRGRSEAPYLISGARRTPPQVPYLMTDAERAAGPQFIPDQQLNGYFTAGGDPFVSYLAGDPASDAMLGPALRRSAHSWLR